MTATKGEAKKLLIHLLIKLGLIHKNFYGKLIFDFQDGEVVHYVKEESGKL
jgi:hypothetical protein